MKQKGLMFLLTGLMMGSLSAEEQKPVPEPVKKVSAKDDCLSLCDATLQNPPLGCGYNTAALYNPCAYANLYVTGSFLYWKAAANYLAYALIGPVTSMDASVADDEDLLVIGKTKDPDFKYKPGYKLGLGYKLNRDRWDLYAEYTRFHQRVHDFIEAKPSDGIRALWLDANSVEVMQEVDPFNVPGQPCYKNADYSWILKLDILDAEMGRQFFLGRYLIVRPTLGLRTLWLDQKFNLIHDSKTDPSFSVVSLNRSSSWGIGPRFCLNNIWDLFGGLKILGNLGISLLHIEDRVSAKHINPIFTFIGEDTDITYKNQEKFTGLKPVLDLSLGLGWGQGDCMINLLTSNYL